MAICNVKHPIKDTVKADNSTYSSNKIESLIHSATELPETSVADAGDVLMVNDEGEWDKGEIIVPQELPTPAAADIGKIVSVVSDGDEGAEYGLETISSSEPFIIEVAVDNQDVYHISENTSLTDLRSAITAKRPLQVFDTSYNGNVTYILTGMNPNTHINQGIDLGFLNTYVDSSRKLYLSGFEICLSMDPTIDTVTINTFYRTYTSA